MHFLRDSFTNPHEFAQAEHNYRQGQSELAALQGEERIQLLGHLGSLARQLNRFEEAESHFHEAIGLAQIFQRQRLEVANRIRLGVTYQYAGHPQAAEACFQEALEQISTQPQTEYYRDFVLQHMGKLLVEQGFWQEALPFFETALILRQQKRDAELIASTEQALAQLATLLSQGETEDDPYGTF